MNVQVPPVYESEESYGMKAWFQQIYRWITQRSMLTNVTTTYTVLENIYYVRADATAGAFTVTIPAALGRDGRQILICKVDAGVNAITVAATGTDTIQGAATISLAAQWSKALLISNGNNGWERIV